MEPKSQLQNESTFTPRAYQIDLYERAVKENIILYLPTGAGKTYIAVMLLKHMSSDIRKPFEEDGKRSIFIVNTVALVEQQTAYISRHTGLNCKGYSGDMMVDYWKEEQWLNEIKANQVLIMTSQIFLNLLEHGYIKLNRINLIIFDECHRAVSNHPMRHIMMQFEHYPKEVQPHVLAMSATLLNANILITKIEPTIRSLEITFHAKIATIESVDCVQGYCTNPKETVVAYKKYSVPEIMTKITSIVEQSIEILKNVKLNSDEMYNESSKQMRPKSKCSKLSSILNDINTTTLQAGLYGGTTSALLHLIQLESMRKFCNDQETDVILDYLITQIMCIRKLFDNEMKNCTEVERVYKFSSDQIKKLFEILFNNYNNNDSKEKFCCIIFVKERFTTKVIYHMLKILSANDAKYSFLLPEYVIGFQNNPYKNSREVTCIAKWNKDVLQKFRRGLINCIVATDVVDEGIDIPTCTLIIRYDIPNDFRGYVQSKGRARHSMSNYVMLMPEEDSNFLQRFYQYKNTESQLRKILVGQSEQRPVPTQYEIKSMYTDYEIKPYLVKRNNEVISSLTEVAAISLINLYCSVLMRSKFSCLVPIWKLSKKNSELENDTQYMVSLKLPILSPLKIEICGDYMKSIDGAKRSAAMKTCIELHKLGALNDKLLPTTNDEFIQNLDYLFPHWVNEDKYQTGTYKKKREHQLEYPLAFRGAYPQPKKQLYLYILDCPPTYYMTGSDNRRAVFYDLLKKKNGFGILSSKNLPKIPSFPLFMKDGKLNVSVKPNNTTISLSEEDITLLKGFHFLLFNSIIPVIKSFMIFDNDNCENSFLIVPLNDMQDINWTIVKTYQCLEPIMPSKPFHFRSSDYELALVTPTYRESSTVYLVTRVCDDLTPESCFPNEDFDTFTHYYKEKHGLTIENLSQSMLEVKPLPIKINYIKPRKLPEGALKYRKSDDTLEDLQEHLIPELCKRKNFPAVYWLKATTLPSILHRICQFLIAEDLRVTIAKETKLGALVLNEMSSIIIEEDIDQVYEEDCNGMELADDSIEITESNQMSLDVNTLELDYNPLLTDQEPRDLYRNIDEIQVLDIHYFNQFMSKVTDEEQSVKKNMNKNVGRYTVKPTVPVPSLKVLASFNEQCLSQGPNSAEIMHALTTKLGQDMFNLERLETLGDSFLKFIVSLFLFEEFSMFNEGQLTSLKGKIIGNRNLYYCGKEKGIPGRIKNDAFVPTSNFIPPAFTVLRALQDILLHESVAPNVLYELQIPENEKLTGIITEDTRNIMINKVINWDKRDKQTGVEHYLGVQILSDKTVADSVEALIGVYLKGNSIRGAVKLLKWFGILHENVNIDKLLDDNPSNPIIGSGNIDYHMPWANAVETNIGYQFKNRGFLLQALTHPSYTSNGITECYQRLEFLGDAILDFLITCYIYENCGNLSPGDLTDLRSALVNNITFACLTVRYGLHMALLAYAPSLHEIIDRFVKFQEERDFAVNDELLCVLIEEDDCDLIEYIDVPKILGDLFESLIGAIYLDSGKSLVKVWEIIYSLMHEEINKFSKNVPKQPVRVIYENTDVHPKFLDAKLITDTGMVMIPLKITIAGKEHFFYGFGVNKKLAKCAAAKQALKRIQLEK